ncbi:hypothetical protein FKM82_025468 [Ascaphus truei]
MMGPRDPFLREVLRFSLCCRGFTLLMQVVFNTLIPDHVADAFSPPRLSVPGHGDRLMELLLGGLGHWDAEHFLFIAERGYVYEHNLAFFPLLPLSLAGLARGVLWPLTSMLSLRSRLLLSAALLNCAASALAAGALYRLGCLVLQCRRSAFLAALLFCMSPASIFMAAAYSESLFALAAFAGLWQLEKGSMLSGSALLSLATAARANGLANIGFLLHWGVRALLRGVGSLGRVGRGMLVTAMSACAVVLPFALFQYYGYRRFCMVLPEEAVPPELLQLAQDKEYRVPGMPPPLWCSAHVPLAYSHVQGEYWGVGPLRYFQLRQLPNFLLALPVAVMGIQAVWDYACANPRLCLALGLWGVPGKPSCGYHGPRVFVYVAHLTALMVFGTLCMHVQVLTRLLFSSSPLLFWFCSHRLQKSEPWLWDPQKPGEEKSAPNPALHLLRSWTFICPQSRALLGYFLGYWVLGTALHVNFLPWT